ncbi:hypothetical protein [Enhygromyxa salina]|uniref:hypothetical protein n=1 Tax=Enhygromyxa salina TaxID=215803 RepID=UPI0011B1E07E|nr:hypothetical protein [Enhygromyxa salina]
MGLDISIFPALFVLEQDLRRRSFVLDELRRGGDLGLRRRPPQRTDPGDRNVRGRRVVHGRGRRRARIV